MCDRRINQWYVCLEKYLLILVRTLSLTLRLVGRALGVGATGTFDLMDDREGGDSASVIKHYLETEGKNYAEFFHV